MAHVHDQKLLNRLKRAQGHLGSIIAMVEENRDCLAIAQQMLAVIMALEKAKTVLVSDHIEHHLETITGPLPAAARDELKRLSGLAKYM
jgi:DNA-binding FrmR family transcriptional regulator